MTKSTGRPRPVCPVCEREMGNPYVLRLHLNAKHPEYEGQASQAPPPASAASKSRQASAPSGPRTGTGPGESALKREGERLIASLGTIGTALALFVPHTGLTLFSRAPRIGKVLVELAREHEQLLTGIKAFNDLMEVGEGSQLALSLAAAVAVDVGLVDPHLEVAMGPVAVRPIESLIGDVIAKVDEMRGEEEEPAPSAHPAGAAPSPSASNGVATADVTPVGGGLVRGGVEDT